MFKELLFGLAVLIIASAVIVFVPIPLNIILFGVVWYAADRLGREWGIIKC